MTLTGTDHFSFGAVLKAFRKRRHLTQQQLAEAIGVHRNAIIRWEQGDFLPEGKEIVLKLARHLHLDDQETRQLLEASLTALSPYWLVPLPRNPFFTGREAILEALHTQLGPDQAVALTQSSALHGLGGVGKTQIALEYAYRSALEYSAVFWIGAETKEQIVTSFLQMAEVLELPGRNEKDQQRVVAAVQRWLGTHSQWLVIWDNVEDLGLLDRFLPPARSGAILITTRCRTLGTRARGLDLLPMEHEEGILFLLRRAKVLGPEATGEQVQHMAMNRPTDYAAASELMTALGGLPLALDQAGAYIEETGCSFGDYLQLYEQHRAILLARRGKQATNHPASVATTWSLSFQKVEQAQPAAAELLRLCAFLASDHIPEELLTEGAIHWPALLQEAVADSLHFNKQLEALLAFSLIKRQAQKHLLSLHRLVQVVQLDLMDLEEQRQWAERVIRAVNTLFPADPKEKIETWPQCLRYLEQVQACDQLIQQYHLQLPEGADLLERAGVYLQEHASYSLAEQFFQRALTLAEQQLGSQPLQAASLLNNLGRLYMQRGKFEQAERLLQRSWHIREQALGPDHPELAHPLNNLGTLYFEQGKYELAEPLYQRTLHIREQALGPDHPQVAHPLNNLGILYSEQGKYELAEPVFQRALHIWEQAMGPDHPHLVHPLTNLGSLYSEQGKYELAEPLYQRALHIWEQAMGPDHPEAAYPLTNLGLLYFEQGKYELAEPLYQRALHIREQTLGPNHPQLGHPLNNLANLYLAQGKYEQAEALFQRALHIREYALSPDHPDVAESLIGLANLSRDQGKHSEAEQLYQRALSIRQQHLGQHHPETAEILHDLALFRQKQGNLGKALTLAQRALSICMQSLGDAHPKTIATQALYDQLLKEQDYAQKQAVSEVSGEALADPQREEPQADNASLLLHKASSASPSENDPLQAFLDACCELHPSARCRSSDLWQAYERWVGEHQERFPLSRRAFAAQVKAHGCQADRTQTARIWRGIALVNKNDDGR